MEFLKKKRASWSHNISDADAPHCKLFLHHLVSLSCTECRASPLMAIKSLYCNFPAMKDSLSSLSGRNSELSSVRLQRPWLNSAALHERFHHSVQSCSSHGEEQSYWATMPPELLRYIIRKVEESGSAWPMRIDVVACASVCRAWREATKAVVESPEISGKLTFPESVMQPGPRDLLLCFIKRDRITSTYRLYLSLTASLTENGKFLLAARKLRKATGSDYIVSLDAADAMQSGEIFVGKLRSNFLGTKFTVHENLWVDWGPTQPSQTKTSTYRGLSRTIDVAHISYELNILGNKGPRRMYCTLYPVSGATIEESSFPPTDSASPSISFLRSCSMYHAAEEDKQACASGTPALPFSQSVSQKAAVTSRGMDIIKAAGHKHAPLMLKNKSPRWHEQLQCWCLNFKGRVTVASVKNFQLVVATELSQGDPQADHDKVLLQFGKIGKDTFTMDFKYPLSAFQAFAICLSSFDTKLASE